MKDDGQNSNKPIPYHHFPRDFEQETYTRALELMEETGNVVHALKAELEAQDKPIPSYATLWNWAKRSKELIDQVRADKREEIIAVSGEVALHAAEGTLDDYDKLTPYERLILYGIAMDKRIAWEGAGKKISPVNVQFNLVTRGQNPATGRGDTIKGEAKDVTDTA